MTERENYRSALELLREQMDLRTRKIAELEAATRMLSVMVYNSRYMGFDREWVRSQISGIANKEVQKMLLAHDAKVRGES
jgi:hypothetical protein